MAIAEKNTATDILRTSLRTRQQRAYFKRNKAHPCNLKAGKEHKQHWCRRRLRRLINADNPSCKGAPLGTNKQRQRSTYLWPTIVIAICLGLSYCWHQQHHRAAFSNFMELYSSQYQAIVHSKLNYCDRSSSLQELFGQLRANVINQNEALNELEQRLNNQSTFQAIALLGSSGVGKSLTLRLLQQHFPWPENVQSYAWNEQRDDAQLHQQCATVQEMLQHLTHCGRNLLIIDNMAPCDMAAVQAINEAALSRHELSNVSNNADMKQLTIVYVFNLNRMLLKDDYEQQWAALQQLPQTTVINYQSFGTNELEQCVRHEAKHEHMQLHASSVQEILSTSDVKASGCKTVRGKVLIYGQRELETQRAE